MVPKSIPLNSYDNTSLNVSVRPPNFVLIFLDDVGYGDFGKFGAEGYDTPQIDKMADEGVMFTDFYVAQAVCGASRAALLTGTLSNRINMLGAPGPNANYGIHENELLIPEMLKQKNYATAMFGKWHLGDNQKFLPTHHGFDEYYGLPYSNDMWPYHPVNPGAWAPLPLIEGDVVINPAVDSAVQRTLTKAYTERSVDFINRKKNEPFFLYLAHSMAHVPLFTSPEFEGVSQQGAYGDVMMEIDWSVGEVLKALKDNNLDSSTFVLLTSDNGPWRVYGNHAGSTGMLGPNRAKGTMFEGGARVPCVMRWPGQIPSGTTVSTPAMTIDVLPTYARLMDGQLSNNIIDGKDIWPVISSEPGASSPHEAYYLYYNNTLNAVRKDNWKLHFPHGYREVTQEGADGQPGTYKNPTIEWELYDLNSDIIERNDVSSSNSNIFNELTNLGNNFNDALNQNKRPRGSL